MGSNLTLYHGSNVIVKNPKVLTNGFYKDFGYGFYCTNLEKQAQRWALTKRNKHIVNIYSYEPDSTLNILKFATMTDEWLEFVVACRRGIEHHYDIVEGPMANDTVWNYVNDFLAGRINRKQFWALAEFKYPTHQISFHTISALDTLKYVGSEAVYGKKK